MNIYDLIDNIKKFMIKNNKEFFSYAWREKINKFLDEESKYAKLIEWIDKQVEIYKNNMNIFNPADKFENYNNGYFKTYEDACKNLAMLLPIMV